MVLAKEVADIQEWLKTHRIPWAEFLGLYVCAGTLHTFSKILISSLRVRRMRRMLEDVPLASYKDPDGLLGFAKDLRNNIKRDKDWWNEASKGRPLSKFLGLKWESTQIALVVRDPLLIKHFLKDSYEKYTRDSPQRNVFAYFLREWIGDGIFILQHGVGAPDNGKAWLVQRKIASNIFSKANFQTNMNEVFVSKGKRFCELLEVAAKSGEPVNMQKMFFGFTMDSITKIFFGQEADTLADSTHPYGDAYDTAHRAMSDYVRPSMAKLLLMKYLPWPFGGVGGLAWYLHGLISPEMWQFKKAVRTLDKESRKFIASARSDPELSKRKDLLALFIQAEEKESFSATYLRDMVLNFVIAGRDTTACTLSWLFYVLSINPEVQRKLQEEIDAKLPDGEAPTFKAVSARNMPYLNGVVYEVLRLYPPVPVDGKTCQEDDVFPDGTKVPKGTLCMWQPYAMGRDANIYPDPMVVKPERWIPFEAPSPHEFPVFQAGPRICLGMDMAQFEAKIATIMLLQKFSFTLKPGEEDKIHYSNTLTMSVCNSKNQDSHDLWLIPHNRLG
eukprot:CAMPEP_0206457992 /NCGR_PEP_ID=MMETSP0324_2-20121206/23293_1 /ASSEMBLY_ACC=CAM_ASM_000836 /TAXON_ID=2866 /ORGANISM="Crypthecodinium cohnii, Strain Seligo" /LENGTH=557 /DNA_ID=CAMNT_0053929223 /DNA_START=41 /DNA_END=1714 /DNA_ORIENTATION=+